MYNRDCFQKSQHESCLLIIQCDSGHLNSDLIACAKYRVDDIWDDMNCIFDKNEHHCYVLFTVLIPREHNKSSFVSFLGGDWICSHIDNFCPETDYSPVTLALTGTPLSKLFYDETIQDQLHHSFNHCQFLYKNIATALSTLINPNSNLAGRSHELNNILYRLLMVHPPMTCSKSIEYYDFIF